MTYTAVLIQALAVTGGLGIIVAMSVAIYCLAADPTSAPRSWWAKYVARLQLLFKSMHDPRDARQVARLQLGLCLGITLYALYTTDLYLGGLVLAILWVPWLVLQQRHHKRLEVIEDQLEGWLLSLANGLKAAPSIGDAIEASIGMVQLPLRAELEVCVKEMKLGTPVDQAVMNLARRVDSSMVTTAITAILIGRQTGGDLSVILERTAATLREMRRLEGVVRAKTAEGRNQAYVLAAMPFVLLGIIHSFDAAWFNPLLDSILGYLVVAIALTAWLSGIVWARKIMSVDI
ncbi:MAG: type II secretion system F family protein [Myxococcales bacterium]|nr:type II secretion system F family protein [Myxococcales bacterium]